MYDVRIETDSASPNGIRLTTMVVTLPRIVLAELNTHRMFSRNSASSRAIPVKRQLERIETDPFLPVYWGRNQSGMQAAEELTGDMQDDARREWLAARDDSVVHAENLREVGLHKQISSRLLEPFMWQTVVITATEWDNFFALRANPDAQPEFRRAAEMMLEAYRSNQPVRLDEGYWHLPFIQPDEYDGSWEFTKQARMVSAARCARVSYLTHDGRRDHGADITLYERLTTSGHMSPLEHVATPFTATERQAREALATHARLVGAAMGLDEVTIEQLVDATAFNGNFRGWTQLRKTMQDESDFALFRKE